MEFKAVAIDSTLKSTFVLNIIYNIILQLNLSLTCSNEFFKVLLYLKSVLSFCAH